MRKCLLVCRAASSLFRSTAWFVLLLIAVAAPWCTAQQLELTNSHVTARFGPDGLQSIQANGGPTRAIVSDSFSLELDSDIFQKSAAQTIINQHDAQQITYTCRNQGYVADVVYRIEPGWRFISKQIRLISTPRPQFTIRAVRPVDVTFGDAVESVFVPGTYLPQFGPPRPGSKKPADDFGAFVRFSANPGVMLLVQDPFLHVAHEANDIALQYAPGMNWNLSWGAFESDIACIGPYGLTGDRIPAKMTYEWKMPSGSDIADGADRAEVRAFTDCVRAFLLHPSPDPISVEVGWTLNDYQIDVATAEGRAEYKRVIDTTSALGIHTLLYSPSNSATARVEDDADTWDWEHVLWLGLGQRLREGKWNVETGEIPDNVNDMLKYAQSKNVGLLAYVYPSLPFAQNSNWLVKLDRPKKNFSASLASRDFQDFLLKELIDFKKRTTGIAGYSFDYTFLNLPGSTAYAQWFGWRRIMEGLRRAAPDIIIDGRQTYQVYGPWSWLAGSYPHPTGNDEQPESFVPYPDLHFDRVSADRTRFVNYWYRNYQFAPEEIVPGYMTHQTERSINVSPDDGTGGHPRQTKLMTQGFRQRDWDYLGYKYSVISSIGTAGWNNVVDMIPARDLQEDRAFRNSADEEWIRHWLSWTVDNRAFLQNTQSILGPPAIGKVDGTSAIVRDRGYLFLFNPNYKQLSAEIRLDSSIGLETGKYFLIRELFPNEGRILGKPGAGLWQYRDALHVALDGTCATVLQLEPAPEIFKQPIVTGASATPGQLLASASLENGAVKLEHVAGEPGKSQEVGVLLPAEAAVRRMMINGKAVQFEQHGKYASSTVRFAGNRFGHSQQVELTAGHDGTYQGTFVVPQRIFKQRAAIEKAWPIEWTPDDYQTTWLVPSRLLLFVQFAEPNDAMNVSMTLDGAPVTLTKAYSSVRANGPSFVGFYADLSKVKPDITHTVTLQTPPDASDRFQGLFFDNVEPELTEQIAQ